MIRFEKTYSWEIDRFVRIAFKDDSELIEKYHIKPGSLDECVKDTKKKICDFYFLNQESVDCYSVWWGTKPIGFLVILPWFLYSFGINIKYRKTSVIREWYEKINEILPDGYGCILWKKNTRTIQFLERGGMREVYESNEAIFLETKNCVMPITAGVAVVAAASAVVKAINGIKDAKQRQQLSEALARLSQQQQMELNERILQARTQEDREKILTTSLLTYVVGSQQVQQKNKNNLIVVAVAFAAVIVVTAIVIYKNKK